MGALTQFKTWQRAILAIALAGAAVAALAWLCARDPKITFLPEDGRAEWIVFPAAPTARIHHVADLSVVFRRQFVLAGPPQPAVLSVRAARHFQVRLNTRPLDISSGLNWKDIASTNVLAGLRSGTNTIEVRVLNDNAPPALWLVLAADQFILSSDRTWEATAVDSAWHPVACASDPRRPGRGNPMAGGESALAAAAAVWPLWLIFSVLSWAVWLVRRWWASRIHSPQASLAEGWFRSQSIILPAGVALLWLALFMNNATMLPFLQGFDKHGHFDYITYIQKHWALPLPNQGWEMFQPPLYYGISAVTLSVFRLTAADPAGSMVLGGLTMLFGVVHIALVFLSLRLLFPGQLGQQTVGLILAAFLPMLLYLSHYVTNETLAAMLVSASVYLCLRILKLDQGSWTNFIMLGLVLGAALLTKFTAVLAVPFVAGALARHLLRRRDPAGGWWKKPGGMLGVAILVSGWNYLRVWRQMGRLVIGGWDPATGPAWWQDDGYHTAAYFERFGESLVHPLFGGTISFLDGIYSTLWGDGLCGGAVSLAYRSPWNYGLMSAGYLLAVLPTLLVLAGAAASAASLIRKGGDDRFVLLGLTFAAGTGLIYLNLTVPYYASVKAFYGLCGLVPFCAFGAVGWKVLTRERKWLQSVLGTLLLVWAMNSYASVWFRNGSASVHAYLGTEFDLDGRTEAAVSELTRAIGLAPSDAQARQRLASVLSRVNRPEEALQQARQAVALDPTDGGGHCLLGTILAGQGQTGASIAEARRAVELGPEDVSAGWLLSDGLLKAGREDEAVQVLRDGLALFPYDAKLHFLLGLAAAQKGALTIASNHFEFALLLDPDWAEAQLNFGQFLLQTGAELKGVKHLRQAVRLAPDSPVALDRLAWVLATSSNPTVRNGMEALQLAGHACALSRRRDPALLGTLAAAYAEAGKFPEAIRSAQEADSAARSMGDKVAAARAEQLLECFQSNQPYRAGGALPP